MKPLGLPAPAERQIKLEVKDKPIRSECRYGMVSRGVELPADVDAEGAKAQYKDGVPHLTLPKKAGAGTRRITVS